MNNDADATVGGKRGEKWDRILKGLPAILVDERNQVGIGREERGDATNTFSVVATFSEDPWRLLEIYESCNPKKAELKYRDGGENVDRVIDG